MNIYLIGYRCTGKTTLGCALAERLAWTFIDMDDVIVQRSAMTISQMVERHGWPYFRQQEQILLQQIAFRKDCVVGTGGGIILDPVNVKQLRISGKVIWLRCRSETIQQRIIADSRTADLRPSLTGKGLLAEIEETLQERIPLYTAAADTIVDTDDFNVKHLCDEIINKIKTAGFEL